jgi:hypothetical protein
MSRPVALERSAWPATSHRTSSPRHTRRRPMNLEVQMIFGLRDQHRAVEQAENLFRVQPTRENLEAWEAAIRNLNRHRRMRASASCWLISRQRHELSLVELRDGCDAYARHSETRAGGNRRRRRAQYWRPKMVPKPEYRARTERAEYFAASSDSPRPVEHLRVRAVGPHAPPVVVLTSSNERGPAT